LHLDFVSDNGMVSRESWDSKTAEHFSNLKTRLNCSKGKTLARRELFRLTVTFWAMDVIGVVLTIILPAVELAGIAAAVHAVMHGRTSQGAIAWGISLVTFPWLALPLYGVFGRSKFKGYLSLRHSRDENVHRIIEQCQWEAVEKDLIVKEDSGLNSALFKLTPFPATRFNLSRLLIDGPQTFEAIFEGIASAKQYILVQFYLVRDDQLGRRFKSLLMEKARQNIPVYFLYDEIGSYQLSRSFVAELRSAGAVVSAFHTTRGKANHLQINFRNHRKIVVIDGRVAFVGGHNVGDEYLSGDPKIGHWRDTHVQVEGPVVKAIQFTFLQDWYWSTTKVPDLDWHPMPAQQGNERQLLVASGPADPMDTCALMFTNLIHSAKERIWIASPYFVPDSQLLGALKLAVLRNVDVRVLLPRKADSLTVHLASFSFLEQILPVGVKLYRYMQGFMHQKVLLVDSILAGIGTANLDNRSLRLNFELTLLNNDVGFIKEVETMLSNDLAHSREVQLEEYTQRSFFFRLAVRFSRLLSPVL
jgi:cardiolipin synthase